MPRSLTRKKLVLSSALYSSPWFHCIDVRQSVRVKNGKLLRDSAMDGIHATFFYNILLCARDTLLLWRRLSISEGVRMQARDDTETRRFREWTMRLAATMLDLGLSYLCIISVVVVLQPLLNQYLISI